MISLYLFAAVTASPTSCFFFGVCRGVLRVTQATCPWTLQTSGPHVYCTSKRKTTQKYKWKPTHSLRCRGYGIGPTQKYKLGLSLPHPVIWTRVPRCRAPEKGGPSSEGCARRGCHEEHEFRKPGPGRPIRRNQQDLFLVLADLAQCLCEKAHWGKRKLAEAQGQLCASASVPRGPRSGSHTTGRGRTRGRQPGLPELPQIDSRTAGSFRDGVAILWGTWAVMRAPRLHDWASPGCGRRVATCAASDSRGGDGGELWHVIVDNPAGLRKQQRPDRHKASSTGQQLEAACLLHVVHQPALEASIVTTTCRDTCSKVTSTRRRTRSIQGMNER